MNVLELSAEAAESCLELAIALMQTAQGQGNLLRTASFVHRCYARALAPPASGHAHDLRWRRFITALDAYLDRCPPSAQAGRLREIVAENADLLDRTSALAS